jgi:membrane protein YqaA with SNARE-associated domain
MGRGEARIEPTTEPIAIERPGRLRRFYAWVLREAHTIEGGVGLVVLAFTGSAIVPLLLEPPLVVLTSGIPRLWRRFALLFALGSIVGGIFTYVVGYAFIETKSTTAHYIAILLLGLAALLVYFGLLWTWR